MYGYIIINMAYGPHYSSPLFGCNMRGEKKKVQPMTSYKPSPAGSLRAFFQPVSDPADQSASLAEPSVLLARTASAHEPPTAAALAVASLEVPKERRATRKKSRVSVVVIEDSSAEGESADEAEDREGAAEKGGGKRDANPAEFFLSVAERKRRKREADAAASAAEAARETAAAHQRAAALRDVDRQARPTRGAAAEQQQPGRVGTTARVCAMQRMCAASCSPVRRV
jgi:hypothetical protein